MTPSKKRFRPSSRNGASTFETDKAFTVQQVINRAVVDEDFHAALLNVAADKNGKTV